jgi:hypothetical protein
MTLERGMGIFGRDRPLAPHFALPGAWCKAPHRGSKSSRLHGADRTGKRTHNITSFLGGASAAAQIARSEIINRHCLPLSGLSGGRRETPESPDRRHAFFLLAEVRTSPRPVPFFCPSRNSRNFAVPVHGSRATTAQLQTRRGDVEADRVTMNSWGTTEGGVADRSRLRRLACALRSMWPEQIGGRVLPASVGRSSARCEPFVSGFPRGSTRRQRVAQRLDRLRPLRAPYEGRLLT